MGWLKKKIKQLGKGIKKIGKKIGGAFKKILKPFAKIFNKLGPLGSIALMMILPGLGTLIAGWGAGILGGTGAFADLLAELGIRLPPGYEQYEYEYDPAREEYLYGQAESQRAGAYSGLTSGLRDIYQQGKASLMQARQPSKGGFAGTGGNLLGMSIGDLYSGVFGERGARTQEAERKMADITAGATEDVRVGREDWRQQAISHLMDLQTMYGEPLEASYG